MYTFSLMMAGSDEWLDVAEAAAFIGKSKHWVYQNRIREGIPHRRIGGSLRFHREELKTWIQESTNRRKFSRDKSSIPTKITL